MFKVWKNKGGNIILKLLFRPDKFKDSKGNEVELEDIEIEDIEMDEEGNGMDMIIQNHIVNVRYMRDLATEIEFMYRTGMCKFKVKKPFPTKQTVDLGTATLHRTKLHPALQDKKPKKKKKKTEDNKSFFGEWEKTIREMKFRDE